VVPVTKGMPRVAQVTRSGRERTRTGCRGPGAVRLPGLVAALCILTCLGGVALAQDDGRRTIGSRWVTINYWPEHEDIALAVEDQANQSLKMLRRYLDLDIESRILIDVVRSHREFNQRVGTKMPTWTLGVSKHHMNHVILQPVRGKRLNKLVTHELTHVALDMKLKRTRGEPPRWLHEGLAQWMEGEMSPVQKDILGSAAVGDDLLSLDELEAGFKGKRETVDLAYAQSHALVQFMIENGPDGVVGRFLQYLMDTGDDKLALRRAMGMRLDVVEQRWIQEIQTRHVTRGVPLSFELIVFGIMGMLFLIAVMVRRNMAREIRERMQEEERVEQLLGQMEVIGEFEDLHDFGEHDAPHEFGRFDDVDEPGEDDEEERGTQ